MNLRLGELYSQIPVSFSQKVEELNRCHYVEHKITNPWLMAASKHYYEASKRIMYIGQEPFTWLGEVDNGAYRHENIPVLLPNLYDIFVNEEHGYNSPIWSLFRRFISIRPDVGFIAGNVAKCGYVGKTGFDTDINIELAYMLREEIRICQPDMILFVCDPNYDDHINKCTHIIKKLPCIDGLSDRKLCKLCLEGIATTQIYRTYHPAYLQRQKKKYKWVNSIYEFLEDKVKSI